MIGRVELSDESWQIAVLSHVLLEHPALLTGEELRREMLVDHRDFSEADAHDVTEMDVVDLLDVDAFPRLRRFISAGLLEARRAAEGVLDRLDADGLGTLFELSFYDAIDSARALDPSAVTVERWAGYRREAAVWIAEVLEDPLEVIDDEDELRHFRDVITAFDVEVEEYVLDGISDRLSEIEDEAMEHRLEEASERERWERDSYGYDRDTSGSDASLDRLFGGLG